MFYSDSVSAPKDDLAAMDAHVASLEWSFGRKLREKIWWIRGSMFGQSGISHYGLSLGSEKGPSADAYIDRHELAHAVIAQFTPAEVDPPALLQEGWAQANSGYGHHELAERALDARVSDHNLTLRKLISAEWYYRHDGPIYPVGGAFCSYLLLRFGHKALLDFYIRSRPSGVVAATPLILGVDFDTLEGDFWRDCERRASKGESKPHE